MKNKIVISFTSLAFILSFIFFSSNFKDDRRIVERQKLSMGTVVQIKVPIEATGDERHIESAIDKAFKEIERVENIFSVYKVDSEISKINRLKAGEILKVQDEVFDLIEKSIEYNEKTEGAFDITVKPLVDLWHSASAKGKISEDEELKSAQELVGSEDIILNRLNKTISFRKEGMSLDLGGIAKGYATDRAKDVLKENGIEDALVNSGGDMYCMGRKSKKELWKVGIQHPRRKDEIFLEIRLEDRAVDSSGDYEKFFLLNGKRYSHIIDPRTGYPVGDDVISATVIAKDSLTADALATALCILGDDGLDMVKSIDEDVDAVIVVKEGKRFRTKMTEGLRMRYEVIEKKNL